VVATGMDGASIAAIEPKVERRNTTAQPLRADLGRAPVAAAAPEPEPVAAYEAPAPVERVTAEDQQQPDLYAAPAATRQPAYARIVDPAVAEADEEDEPLFAEPAFEARRPRGGFLSLFGGRPRYDQALPAASQGARASAG